MCQGIYQIKVKNKIYIGSSTQIFSRWSAHLNKLKHQNHGSPILQSYFNKYGESVFQFSIVERVDDSSQLLTREQFYLDSLKPKLNCCPTAGRPGQKSKSCVLIDNYGKKIRVSELTSWCHDKKLKVKSFYSLLSGKIQSLYGYTKNLETFHRLKKSLIHPEVGLIEFVSAKKFCNDYGVSETAVYDLLSGSLGRTREGWQLYKVPIKRRDIGTKVYTVVSPYGEEVKISNLKEWCLENKHSRSAFLSFLGGSGRSYKGYTRNLEDFNSLCFTLEHKVHGIIKCSKKSVFSRDYKVPYKTVQYILSDSYKDTSSTGWTRLNQENI